MRAKRGVSHVHAGTVHAPDAELALQNARDLFTRRSEGVSLWVVRSSDITASDPDDRDSMFDPAPTRRSATRPTSCCPTKSPTCERRAWTRC